MYKIGMIGTSLIAKKFVKATDLNEKVSLEIIYSRNIETADNFKKEFGFKNSTDKMEELLTSDVDFIYIATPNKIHYQQVKSAILAKKNVIIEKPITISIEQTKELYELAEEYNVILIEAVKTIAMNTYQYVKEHLIQLGHINLIELNINRSYENYPKQSDQVIPNIYRYDMDGGVLSDLGSYALYPLADLTQDDFEISVSSFKEEYLDVETDLQVELTSKQQEMLVKINLSMKYQGENSSTIYGENGKMTIDSLSQFNLITVYDKDDKLLEEVKADHEHMMQGELAEMVKCIELQKTKSELYTAELALRCQEIMQQIRNNL